MENTQQPYTIRTMKTDTERLKEAPKSPPPSLPPSDLPSDIKTEDAPPAPANELLLPPPSPKNYLKKPLIAAGIILIIVAGASGIIYWLKYQKAGPLTAPEEKPPTEQIFSFEKEETIILEENTPLLNSILTLKTKDFTPNILLGLLIQRQKEQKTQTVSLQELITRLNLNIPPQIAQLFEQNYNLFLYSKRETDGSVPVNRLGLIFSLNQPSLAPSLMRQWEETIIQDLKPLFLEERLNETFEFKESERKDILPHQYVNLPSSELSLDYALYKNLIIIATSKDSMDKILDLLLNQ